MLMRGIATGFFLASIPRCGPVVAEGCVTFRVVSTLPPPCVCCCMTPWPTWNLRKRSSSSEIQVGNVWHALVKSSDTGSCTICRRRAARSRARLWFDGRARLIIPTRERWPEIFNPRRGVLRPPKCVVIDDHFDWRGDRYLNHRCRHGDLRDARGGFTKSPPAKSSFPALPGRDREDPYLKSLG